VDLVNGRTDGLKLSLKLYHGNELQLAYQQLITEAPDDRAHAAGTKEAGERRNDMNEKDNQIAHLLILTKPGITWGYVTN